VTHALEEATAPSHFVHWGYATWSLVAYRAGDWKRAAEVAEKAMTEDFTWHDAQALFVSAMANHRVGERETARKLLDRARSGCQSELPMQADGAIDVASQVPRFETYYDLIIIELLRREAEALFVADDPPRPDLGQ
jgi:hypothetical protein